MTIRSATDSDLPAILAANTDAFGPRQGPEVTQLVTDLLIDPTAQPLLSLVAERDGAVVGHVLFTPVRLDPASPVTASILAPLAIIPAWQRQGIGGALISEGLRRLTAAGVGLVFVLGHPTYYPRHGFTPAGVLGLHAPYPIPPEHADAWMVQPLHPGLLGQVAGTARCATALDRPEHWRE